VKGEREYGPDFRRFGRESGRTGFAGGVVSDRVPFCPRESGWVHRGMQVNCQTDLAYISHFISQLS
jgi:hypothetical protein